MPVVVLSEYSVFTVWDTVLAQVPGTHASRQHFQVAPRESPTTPATTKACDLGLLEPFRGGHALPCPVTDSGPPSELNQPHLLTAIGLEFQGVVVLPRDVHSKRQAHDGCGTKCLAFVAARSIFLQIPGIGDTPPLGVQGD